MERCRWGGGRSKDVPKWCQRYMHVEGSSLHRSCTVWLKRGRRVLPSCAIQGKPFGHQFGPTSINGQEASTCGSLYHACHADICQLARSSSVQKSRHQPVSVMIGKLGRPMS